MKYRYFRQVSTGQWLDAVLGSTASFNVSASQHVQEIAAGFGLPGDVEVWEVDTIFDPEDDPRTGPFLALEKPETPPTSEEIARARLEVLLSADTLDANEEKELRGLLRDVVLK